jgi:hypothetical protein
LSWHTRQNSVPPMGLRAPANAISWVSAMIGRMPSALDAFPPASVLNPDEAGVRRADLQDRWTLARA